jgi:hypothetical protein
MSSVRIDPYVPPSWMDALNPDAIPKFRVHLANGLPTPIQTLDTPGKVSTIMMTNSNVIIIKYY